MSTVQDRVPREIWAHIADAADPSTRLALSATSRVLYEVARGSHTPQNAAVDALQRTPLSLSAIASRRLIDDWRHRAAARGRQLFGDRLHTAIWQCNQVLQRQLDVAAAREAEWVRAPGLRLPGFRSEVGVAAAIAATGLALAYLDIQVHPLAGAGPQAMIGAFLLRRTRGHGANVACTGTVERIATGRQAATLYLWAALVPMVIALMLPVLPAILAARAQVLCDAAYLTRVLQAEACAVVLGCALVLASPLSVAQRKGFDATPARPHEARKTWRLGALCELHMDATIEVPRR